MIRREVHQHRDGGPEHLNRLQLEGTHFERHVVERARLVGNRAERRADVASSDGLEIVLRQHALDEFRRGGLAVGSSDGNVQREGLLVAEFQFADERNFFCAQLDDQRIIQRHAGADDREIIRETGRRNLRRLHGRADNRGRERRQFPHTEFHAHPVRAQPRRRLTRGRVVQAVHRHHAPAACDQQLRRRHATQAEADDQHIFVFNHEHKFFFCDACGRFAEHVTVFSKCSTRPPRTARTGCKTASPPGIRTSPSSRSDGAAGTSKKFSGPRRIFFWCI